MTIEAVAESQTTEVAVFEVADPVAVLTDQKRFADFYERVKAETDKLVPDVTTKKGRDAIKSMAFKVVKTKTALDEAGKKLNESARAQINLVDAARRDIREKLDALRDEVRAPLDAWEAAEAKRMADCQAVIDRIQAAGVVTLDDTSASVADRLKEIEAVQIDEAAFQEHAPAARAAWNQTTSVLVAAVERLTKEEADRAELERLRAEAAVRAEAERIAAEKAETERLEAERKAREEADVARRAEEEKARIAAAEEAARQEAMRQAEQARIEAEQRAERERQEAEERAAAERRRMEEAHAAEVARLQREAAEAKAREEAAQRAREAEERAQAEAEAARAADRAHRSEVMAAAKSALMQGSCALSETAAKKVVLAICAGEITHVSIKF